MIKELVKEKWQNKVSLVTIGTENNIQDIPSLAVKIGGQSTLPFMFSEGEAPHRPVIAAEIWDSQPQDWAPVLNNELKDVYSSPVAWAKKMAKDCGVDLICLRLEGAHPDSGNRSPEQEVQLVKDIVSNINAPLIIIGCGFAAKDNLVLPACMQAVKDRRFLFGCTTQDNYKTLAAACLADGHNIIAQSPIDINIAKQLNILISEIGFPLDRIVIDPTVGALGYGLEYAYSIMERARLAAFTGDKMLAQPFICFVGQESWRAKEAKAAENEYPQWGKELERGVTWEALTAAAFLQSGADILVMRHPKAIKIVREHIDKLMKY